MMRMPYCESVSFEASITASEIVFAVSTSSESPARSAISRKGTCPETCASGAAVTSTWPWRTRLRMSFAVTPYSAQVEGSMVMRPFDQSGTWS